MEVDVSKMESLINGNLIPNTYWRIELHITNQEYMYMYMLYFAAVINFQNIVADTVETQTKKKKYQTKTVTKQRKFSLANNCDAPVTLDNYTITPCL